jgi:hypothetical protein
MWRPLLEGTLADEARRAGDAVARDLDRCDIAAPHVGGAAGIALFLAHHAAACDDAESDAAASRWLDRAVAGLAAQPLPFALYQGFTGIAWVADHLADGSDDIDATLLDALASDALDPRYDLISGVVGAAVYAFARAPRPAAVACLEHIIDRLARTAEDAPEGATWFTPPRWLSADERARAPSGYYNLGVAHGVPGVIAILARAVEAGIAVDRAKPLLERAVAWVLAQRVDGPASHLPAQITRELGRQPSRSAWCYGDPGVAIALLGAGRRADVPAWSRAGHELLRALARRSIDACGVRDAGFCHGAVGLAHLLARGYAITDDPELRAGAIAWYERALAMRRPGTGIGGFTSYRLGPDGTFGDHADPELLGGAPGIGLALLAGLVSHEPNWDRLMLADVPLLVA